MAIRMRSFCILFVFCLACLSCGSGNKVKIPKDVIGRDTMVEVLTDIHLLKAAKQMGVLLDTKDSADTSTFNYVWNKHHITEQEYDKSLDFYTHHPAVLDSIYENVLNNLSKQRAELMAQKHLK